MMRQDEDAGQVETDAIELLPVTDLGQTGPFSVETVHRSPHGTAVQNSRRKAIFSSLCATTACILITLVVIYAVTSYSRSKSGSSSSTSNKAIDSGNQAKGFEGVTRIAFGSCTAYDQRDITIFQTGIIPLEPDVWIWVGDMVYMDTASVDCHLEISNPQCSCDSTFMAGPPTQCFAGDFEHARAKVTQFVGSSSYQGFLDYMCPGHRLYGGSGGTSTVPHGSNPEVCQRAVLGTYDDHDFGWNNGNRRLPRKESFKNLYLDAIGEPPGSPRRSMISGLQTQVKLNSKIPEQQIDVFLLDERYERTPIPCSTYFQYCKDVLDISGNKTEFQRVQTNKTIAWCQDFIYGGLLGEGSCCPRDEELFKWCNDNRSDIEKNNSVNATREEACDPTSPKFGKRNLVVREGVLKEADPHSFSDMEYSSQFCEVLGQTQRAWLREALQASQAPLKLIASGSVLLGRPSAQNSDDRLPMSANNICSGDDFDCYRAAQLNLIHSLGNSGNGCVVILTGDYHYADLKSVDPYSNAMYTIPLQTSKLKKPLYQVMASGLSNSTASGATCSSNDLWMRDIDGLRMAGECGFYAAPNFGFLEIDWKKRQMTLSIRTETGAVAVSADETDVAQLAFKVDLETCRISGTT